LSDGGVEHRSTPDQRLTGLDQQTHGYHLDAIGLGGDESLSLWRRQFFHAEHGGSVGSIDIGVHETDAGSALSERNSNVHGDGGLAHAAFA
jgi:hypothetical protein